MIPPGENGIRMFIFCELQGIFNSDMLTKTFDASFKLFDWFDQFRVVQTKISDTFNNNTDYAASKSRI